MEDFGFTFDNGVEETKALVKDQIDTLQSVNDEFKAEINRLLSVNRTMYNKITILLNNLKKNPEKPNIHWPDREQAITKFQLELDELREKKEKDGKNK